MSNVKQYTLPVTTVRRRILERVVLLNGLVFAIMISGQYSHAIAAAVGAAFVLGLSLFALHEPQKVFFLLFGIKLTYDALWFVEIPVASLTAYGLLELILLPVIVLLVAGPKVEVRRHNWILACSALYILWIILARMVNGYEFDTEMIVRQSGIFFGLLLGLRYIRTEKDLELLAYAVFISTIIPVCAGLLQLAFGYFGLDIAFFHFKIESVRGVRPSGLYYDSGTAGMVYLMSTVSNLYILFTPGTPYRYKRYLLVIFFGSIVLLFAGGTVSMIMAMCGVATFLILRAERRGHALFVALTVVLSVFVFGAAFQHIPYIAAFMDKIDSELSWFEQGSGLQNLSWDPAYAHLLTGRVGLWQNIWSQFESGTMLQRLFGTGLPGSHSTYFHLLLQIGILGLIFYLVFHWRILKMLWHIQKYPTSKYAALLSVGWILLIGVSLTTVLYTSFQWLTYMLVGGALNIGYQAFSNPLRPQYTLSDSVMKSVSGMSCLPNRGCG